MKYEPYPATTLAYQESLCNEWTETIKNHESGVWIWVPMVAPYRRIWQFQHDIAMQKKLFGKLFGNIILIHVELQEKENITKQDMWALIINAIQSQTTEKMDTAKSIYANFDAITKKNDTRIGIFVTGVDSSIKKQQWEVFEELNYLAQSNWNVSILIISETDVTHPEYFLNFNKRSTLAQNITVVPIYSRENVEAFLKYLCYNWEVKLLPEQKQWIIENCGGHYLLIKDIVRNIRKNSHLSVKDIEGLESMRLRGVAIANNLLPDQRKVISSVLNHIPIPDALSHSKDFLLKQQLLINKNGELQFTIPYLGKFILNSNTLSENINNEYNYHLIFTSQELKIFELLKSNEAKILSRNQLAESIWETDLEEKYSEWAIDQMIHRIRTKIKSAKIPYEIKTKKGFGFILLHK